MGGTVVRVTGVNPRASAGIKGKKKPFPGPAPNSDLSSSIYFFRSKVAKFACQAALSRILVQSLRDYESCGAASKIYFLTRATNSPKEPWRFHTKGPIQNRIE